MVCLRRRIIIEWSWGIGGLTLWALHVKSVTSVPNAVLHFLDMLLDRRQIVFRKILWSNNSRFGLYSKTNFILFELVVDDKSVIWIFVPIWNNLWGLMAYPKVFVPQPRRSYRWPVLLDLSPFSRLSLLSVIQEVLRVLLLLYCGQSLDALHLGSVDLVFVYYILLVDCLRQVVWQIVPEGATEGGVKVVYHMDAFPLDCTLAHLSWLVL